MRKNLICLLGHNTPYRVEEIRVMWKIYNYLFGWDYVTWVNSADQGIARVHVDKNGNVFYWRYKITKISDPIKCAKNHLWLTCPPEKYGLNVTIS